MAEVTVRIAGREYRLGCADGEEEELIACAGRMDGIANALQRRMSRPVSEERLLVMIGMTLADELAAVEARVESGPGDTAESSPPSGDAPEEPPGVQAEEDAGKEIAGRIAAIADRIERLSRKIA